MNKAKATRHGPPLPGTAPKGSGRTLKIIYIHSFLA